jgi:hypothetical protein
MRWRDRNQLELRRDRQGLLHVQALIVDRNRYQPCAARAETIARNPRTRVFKPYRIARIEQDPREKIKRLLRAAGDINLLGSTLQSTLGVRCAAMASSSGT